MAPGRRPCVVVGYDGSEASRCAVAVAARHAGAKGLVCIVHAYQSREREVDGESSDGGRLHAQAMLDAVLLTGDDELLDTEYETELIEGSAAGAIAAVARERDADQIIVGARGLGRLHTLLGSVSQELLHLADRPVVVIPAGAVATVQRRLATAPANR